MTTAAPPSPPTEPIAVLSSSPPWRQTFVSLGVRNYRLFASANLIAMSAVWMQRIAQDWLALELTGSTAAVGAMSALQFGPMLLFGLLGGLIVDRYRTRTLLVITQSLSFLTSAVLAVVVLLGIAQIWHVFAAALVLGFVTVVDNPARQVFTGELVGPRLLPNAISLNSSGFQLGGIIGPAASAVLLVSVGAGWSFAINALACASTVVALTRLRSSEMHPVPRAPRRRGQLIEGLRYAAAKPAILWTIVIMGVLAVFSQNLPVLLAGFADHVFGTGAGGYGAFNTLVAVGALTGAILSTRRRTVRLRTVVLCALGYAAAQSLTALLPTETAFGAGLVVTGLGWLLFITCANTLVQMSSNAAIRGRVMALYVLVLLGGQALGGPIMGQVVENVGARAGMLLSGAVPVVVIGVIGLVLARRSRSPRGRIAGG